MYSYAQALMHMEELKLYASSTQWPESDEMYVDALRLHARIKPETNNHWPIFDTQRVTQQILLFIKYNIAI